VEVLACYAGDLARLGILTRMQGNPAKRFLNAREESNLKELRTSKRIKILMSNCLRKMQLSEVNWMLCLRRGADGRGIEEVHSRISVGTGLNMALLTSVAEATNYGTLQRPTRLWLNAMWLGTLES